MGRIARAGDGSPAQTTESPARAEVALFLLTAGVGVLKVFPRVSTPGR